MYQAIFWVLSRGKVLSSDVLCTVLCIGRRTGTFLRYCLGVKVLL